MSRWVEKKGCVMEILRLPANQIKMFKFTYPTVHREKYLVPEVSGIGAGTLIRKHASRMAKNPFAGTAAPLYGKYLPCQFG